MTCFDLPLTAKLSFFLPIWEQRQNLNQLNITILRREEEILKVTYDHQLDRTLKQYLQSFLLKLLGCLYPTSAADETEIRILFKEQKDKLLLDVYHQDLFFYTEQTARFSVHLESTDELTNKHRRVYLEELRPLYIFHELQDFLPNATWESLEDVARQICQRCYTLASKTFDLKATDLIAYDLLTGNNAPTPSTELVVSFLRYDLNAHREQVVITPNGAFISND